MKRCSRAGNRLELLLSFAVFCGSFAASAQVVSKQTARSGPEWLRNGVVYEVFPRDFSAEGNFNGITARLDELKGLGVNILWLMPIHPLGEKMRKGTIGSPYAVRDYYAINPDYGTEADFKRLVTEAHQRGFKVVMDLVANHTAWDSVMMAHPDFYKQDANGKIIPPEPNWTDVAGLNYANPKLREYMLTMMKYWVNPATFDVDGYRCDVAYAVPTSFWEEARAELVKVKPDIMMLAEASKPELLVKAFDIDYSWPLHSTLNDVLLKGAPATAFKQSWEQSRREFPSDSLHLRFSDNHDEARAVARFGVRGALACSVLMFSLDGVPLIYNGMEVGDATESGDPALFERLPIFWHPKDRSSFRPTYQDLIKMRSEHPAFHSRKVTWVHNSDEANVVTFLRSDDKEELLVAINFSNRGYSGKVDVDHAGEFQPVKLSGTGAGASHANPPGLRLNGFEWRIFRREISEVAEHETTPGGNSISSSPTAAATYNSAH